VVATSGQWGRRRSAADRPGPARRRSVSVTLLVTVLVATTAVAVTVVLSFQWTSERARDDAASDARFQAGLAAESVQSSLTRISTALGTAAAAPSTLAKLHAPAVCSLTAAGLNGYRGSHVDLVLPDGRVPCSSLAPVGAPAGATYGNAPWVARGLASPAPVVVRTATDPLTRRAAVTIAARIVEGGQPVALITAVVPVHDIADGLASAFAGPRGLTFTIVEPGRDSIRSASGVEGEQWTPYAGSGFDAGRSGTWAALDGRERLFASAAVPQLGWRVFSGVDTGSITAEAREAAGRQGILAIVALLAQAALAWLVSRRIVRPLQAVTESIVAARDEPMPAPVPVGGPREVAVLASEFNAMIEARLGYEAQLTDRALHDDLTQLPNRALLRDRLERSIRATTGGATLAVLFLDLDRFKLVNDSLGHPAGDALLQLVAARLTTALRPHDTLARFGGDVFVGVCEAVDGAPGAVEIARRLEASLAEPFSVHGQSVDVSAKFGIALTTDPRANPDELVREADIAMYQAKDTDRAWELWDDDLQIRSAHRLELLQDLRRAVEQREIVVLYQPIWDVEEWQIVSVEALVRWDHPRLGRLAPGQFVPLAEDSGEIRVIGQYVLEEALRFVATLMKAGHPLTVSVNVAVSQLDEAFVAGVAERLENEQLPPECLCLEVTESALCDALGSRADALTVLRAMGVHTAVDDFGTGYSSLSYFQHFPFDTLKIDRSFIEPLGADDGRAAALVDAITSMARALDLHVVGEGVETAEQLAAARALGVRYVQGFLLAKPLEAAELRALVRRQHVAPAAVAPPVPRLNPA
jgi:diguanylate cyclase (GGDEF)-like protein